MSDLNRLLYGGLYDAIVGSAGDGEIDVEAALLGKPDAVRRIPAKTAHAAHAVNVIKYCPHCHERLHERTNSATGARELRCLEHDCTHREPLPESVRLRREGQSELPLFEEEP